MGTFSSVPVWAALACVCGALAVLLATYGGVLPVDLQRIAGMAGLESSLYAQGDVAWTPCSGEVFRAREGPFVCGEVRVTMDYAAEGEGGAMVSVAVARIPAKDREGRQGSVFLITGGPGMSGLEMVAFIGPAVSRVLEGKYDILGFDPRGIGSSKPALRCFDSKLDQEAFSVRVNDFNLDLPTTVKEEDREYVKRDIARQLGELRSAAESAGRRCVENTGEAIGYVGTENVVRDVERIARAVDGEDAKINAWGFSYGTVIGQYLLSMLPRERIGKIILDGVVNPELWVQYPHAVLDQGLRDAESVFDSFVNATAALQDETLCPLSRLSAEEIKKRVYDLVDELHAHPSPLSDFPAMGKASHARRFIFDSMMGMGGWPALCRGLSEAIIDKNYTSLLSARLPRVNQESIGKPGGSVYAGQYVYCADAKPYTQEAPRPPLDKLAEKLLENYSKYSPLFAEGNYLYSLCTAWGAALPNRTRFSGPFTLKDKSLDTPALIISNTFDVVTPLEHGLLALNRYGRHAHIIEQSRAAGHISLTSASFCTAKHVREYILDGRVPEERHTTCEVDAKAFEPVRGAEVQSMGQLGEHDAELWDAWKEAVAMSDKLFRFAD